LKIHEYQAKELFAEFGIPVPGGKVAFNPEEAHKVAKELGKPVMIKAQVHVGGRGKAGGIKMAKDPDEAKRIAGEIIGMRIKGLTVGKVLVTEAVEIDKEYYLGIVIDRSEQKPLVMVSEAGGIDIEDVARETPEKIHRGHFDPVRGLMAYQARNLAWTIDRRPKVALKVASIMVKLAELFMSTDSSLAEINPLVVTGEGEVIALDAKVNIDDNSLFRHPRFVELREDESAQEGLAREAGLSYVKLEGNIGCVVNGAGLAMATMDLIKAEGGEPANFLDIGGSSSPEKVTTALKIILADPGVKAILFNIFGGITRCDDVANGIVEALGKAEVKVPIVARLTGTNEAEGKKILEKMKLNFASTMDEGVKRAVKLAG